MPRIRTVKPEFWTSEQVLELSIPARLLFIGLWNFCDDAGRHKASARQVKAEIFPADDITSQEISTWLDELACNGLIVFYDVEDTAYFQVTGWKHQQINKPQTPKHPGPEQGQFREHSGNGTGAFREHSRITTAGKDRKGKDRKGEEGIGIGCTELAAPASEPYMAFPVIANDGEDWILEQAKVLEWQQTYTSLDVDAEIAKARQWCVDTPARRKTPGGMIRFLGAWLARAQNGSGQRRVNGADDAEARRLEERAKFLNGGHRG